MDEEYDRVVRDFVLECKMDISADTGPDARGIRGIPMSASPSTPASPRTCAAGTSHRQAARDPSHPQDARTSLRRRPDRPSPSVRRRRLGQRRRHHGFSLGRCRSRRLGPDPSLARRSPRPLGGPHSSRILRPHGRGHPIPQRGHSTGTPRHIGAVGFPLSHDVSSSAAKRTGRAMSCHLCTTPAAHQPAPLIHGSQTPAWFAARVVGGDGPAATTIAHDCQEAATATRPNYSSAKSAFVRLNLVRACDTRDSTVGAEGSRPAFDSLP